MGVEEADDFQALLIRFLFHPQVILRRNFKPVSASFLISVGDGDGAMDEPTFAFSLPDKNPAPFVRIDRLAVFHHRIAGDG